MKEFFTPEESHRYSGRYSNNYVISISSAPDFESVQISTTDADESVALAELSPSRAREVAKALGAAADDVEARRPCQVGDLNPTASQLDSLPKGSVVRFDDPPFNGSRFALKANNVILDQWVTDSGADWGSSTLATRGNTKIIFIPEETA